MNLDFTAANALLAKFQTGMTTSMTAAGVAAPTGTWLTAIADLFLTFLGQGGCSPTASPTPSQVAAQIKTVAADNPLIFDLTAARMIRKGGLANPIQGATALRETVNAASVDDVTNFAALGAQI